jgi:hypothetical protein
VIAGQPPARAAAPAAWYGRWVTSSRSRSLLLLIVLLAAACGGSSRPKTVENAAPPSGKPAGTARVDLRSRDQGVITLLGDRAAAMEAAAKEMAAHCGDGAYTITQEGEDSDGEGASAEWRVHYRCEDSALLPPP